jgi:hypothetical protein
VATNRYLSNEVDNHLCVKHLKIYEALRLKYVLKGEIMNLKEKLSKIQVMKLKCVAQWA